MKAWVLIEEDRIVARSEDTEIQGGVMMDLPDDMEMENLHKYRKGKDGKWSKSKNKGGSAK